MPSLEDLARAFTAVTTLQLLVGLLLCVAIVVVLSDWRISLLALAVQYLLVAVLLSTLIPLQIAAVRMIAGGLVATMFYITARRVKPLRRRQRGQIDPLREEELPPIEEALRGVFWMNLPFRVISLALVAISVIALSTQFVLLNAPTVFWVTGLWLATGGLVTVALTRDALKLGMGLLFFTSGFGVIYLSIDNSLLIYALLGVFIAGLMIGRTPEYLGKKIEAFEMKMASIVILMPPLVVLLGTAIAVLLDPGKAGVANPGTHGFSEILYAFSSAGNNNGSAFAGLTANESFYDTALGVVMLIARFWLMVPTLAIAGSLARKKFTPPGAGTLPTHTPLFVVLVVGSVLLVGALTFIPALGLGPIVEHLQMTQ
jgi:hypothetical protein